jgi:hypothetical protein
MNVLQGLWPGEVASYNAAARTCRVRIVGITEGSTELPEAVFNNALGDRAGDTEIRILVGDPVWLMFEAGDPRFPIIMGYRTPRAGNPVDWRRWRHANIEMTADGEMIFNANSITFNAATETHNVAGALTVAAGTESHTAASFAVAAESSFTGGIAASGGGVAMQGPLAVSGGTITHDGKDIGATHTHGGVLPGGANTAVPN